MNRFVTKIFREALSGDRLKIVASIHANYSEVTYKFMVYRCEKGKRIFNDVTDTNSSKWRKLSFEEKAEYNHLERLSHATPAQVQEVMQELWESLVPKPVFSEKESPMEQDAHDELEYPDIIGLWWKMDTKGTWKMLNVGTFEGHYVCYQFGVKDQIRCKPGRWKKAPNKPPKLKV